MVDPIADVFEAVRLFTDVALGDPISAVLVLFGGLFVALSVAVLGYLTLGALVDAVTPESTRPRPPQRG